jgi:hypothetical protein
MRAHSDRRFCPMVLYPGAQHVSGRSAPETGLCSPARLRSWLIVALEPHADGTPRRIRWDDVLRAVPEPPRPLRLEELRRLRHLGFPELAVRLAAGRCPRCGLSKAGRGHRDLCVVAEEAKRPKLAAAPAPRQPWEPRPSRRAA